MQHPLRFWVAATLLLFAAPLHAAEPRPLTSDGRIKRDLVWLPDGRLVFSRQDQPELLKLYRLDPADGSCEPLHPQANSSELEPAFSADGKLCAFVQSVGNLHLKVMLQPFPDGNTVQLVDPGGGFAGIRHPSFAADGERVVYSQPASGGQQLFSVNLKGEDRRELTKTAGINNHPSFSPDGTQIAFSSSRDENFEIYVIQADGSNPRRLTDHPGMDIRPRWSPDGKRLAFVSNRDGNYEIYIMPSSGGKAANLTQYADRDDFPAWHPDGKRIAFVSVRRGQEDVFVIDAP